MKLKLYYPSIFLVLIFHATFITFPYWNYYYYFKYLILFIVALFLLFNYKVIFNKKYKEANCILLLYIGSVIISSYINRNNAISRNVFLSSIVYGVTIFETFFLFEYFSLNKREKNLINVLYNLLFIYIILSDVLMLIKPTLHIEKGMYYLVGNKFTISYLHLQWIVLYLQKNKDKTFLRTRRGISLLFHFFITLIMCIYVDCSTGIIGLFTLLLLFFVSRKNEYILRKPSSILTVLAISSSILLIFRGLLKSRVASFVIEDILNADLTLTGRTPIYDNIGKVLQGHMLFGYGIGSSFDVVMKSIGAPNTQNGILECVLEQGTISTVLLLMLIYVIFKEIKMSSSRLSILFIIYVYAILSSVEITIDTSFITFLALLLACGFVKEKSKTRLKDI